MLLAFPLWGGSAEAGAYRFAITPVIGYRMGGDFEDEETSDEVNFDDDSMFGFIINAPYQSLDGDVYTEWELYSRRQKAGLDSVPSTVDGSLELEISYFLIGGTYVGAPIGEGELLRPFLAAGIGAAHLNPEGSGYDSDTVFGFGIGGGAMLYPARRIGLRREGRMLGAIVDSDSSIFCRSGLLGSACAFRASGDVLLQGEIAAGVVARF